VGVKNRYLRSHAIHVQFANEQGPLPFTPSDNLDSDRAAYVDVVFTNDTLLGIPLIGDLVETQRFSFDVPDKASKATIYFGSLGVGGDPFCPEAVYGSILTLGFSLAIAGLQMLLNLVPGVATRVAVAAGASSVAAVVPLGWVIKLLSAGAVA